MTALSIVQNAWSRLGLDNAPSAVFSSTDGQVIQFRTLMNEEGLALTRDPDMSWTALMKEQTFVTVAQETQTSAIPTDFGWYLDDSMWNRTTMIKLAGPTQPEEWQAFKAIAVISLPAAVFRFRGGNILIYPTQTAGQNVYYEYSSTYWVSGSKTAMTADTDTAVISEEIITLGLIWRFLKAKGVDYAEQFRTYQMAKQSAIGRDGGKRKVYLGGGVVNPWNANVPQGNWPGSGNP